MIDSLALRVDIARAMGQRLHGQVQRFIKSRTLRRALEVRTSVDGSRVGADLVISQYWAVYYHDGRGPLRPRNGKFLVWFKRVEDDPRVDGGANYPVRATDIRRLSLSPAEFTRMLASGRMIIARRAGPTFGNPFFNRLANRAPSMVRGIAPRMMSTAVRRALAETGLDRIMIDARVRL